ncbi:MAG: cation:proton antiporter subunit C [Pseudomonadota bacterium]
MAEFVLERANYWAIIGLMMVGLYITFQSTNMIKRLVGLSIFQTSVFLFYITLGKVAGGTAPILFGKDAKGHGDGGGHLTDDGHDNLAHGTGETAAVELGVTGNPGGLQEIYSNPLPHVLILTAIVVGVSTLAVGLALVVRIRESYGTIESDEVRQSDIETADAQDADDPARQVA